ncbi:hypothetical protein GOACH_33_00360 [Gordonia aichiensis NBRC 108223]|uniref:Uncharacterized protein n=1 Tax=Gordonia aichiensis NBRC 108223 TaxID=1220583 RepID=L7KPX8_9ACTN|nr:hypothetical protein GOACH_33_00360 [Gordonia aichiensis NBRC 108223]
MMLHRSRRQFRHRGARAAAAKHPGCNRPNRNGTHVAGLIRTDTSGSGPVPAPPALLTRIARILTTAAEHTSNTDLAATLRRDVMRASG